MADEGKIDWAALSAPFRPDEIEWRVGNHSAKGDRCTLLVYLTARAVMDRLDAVVGPGRWRDSYAKITIGKEEGFLCTLEVEVADGRWVAKQDAADVTDIEATKGGISAALKRAAVKWGIGRYLYAVPDSGFLEIKKGWPPKGSDAVRADIGTKEQRKEHKAEVGHVFPPKLPDEFLPVEMRHKAGKEARKSETEEQREQRQEEHDPSWEAEKGAFFKRTNELKFIGADGYDELVRFCLWRKEFKKGSGLRPSRMDSKTRGLFLKYLESDAGAREYADFIDYEFKNGKYGEATHG